MNPASRFEIPAEEVDAAMHARKELGADSETGVIDAFLERTARAIDTRVDARLAAQRMVSGPSQHAATPRPPAKRPDGYGLAFGLGSIGIGIPLTAISTQFGGVRLAVVIIIWAAITLVNISYNAARR